MIILHKYLLFFIIYLFLLHEALGTYAYYSLFMISTVLYFNNIACLVRNEVKIQYDFT